MPHIYWLKLARARLCHFTWCDFLAEDKWSVFDIKKIQNKCVLCHFAGYISFSRQQHGLGYGPNMLRWQFFNFRWTLRTMLILSSHSEQICLGSVTFLPMFTNYKFYRQLWKREGDQGRHPLISFMIKKLKYRYEENPYPKCVNY